MTAAIDSAMGAAVNARRLWFTAVPDEQGVD
jgi:hypothetical protein